MKYHLGPRVRPGMIQKLCGNKPVFINQEHVYTTAYSEYGKKGTRFVVGTKQIFKKDICKSCLNKREKLKKQARKQNERTRNAGTST